MTLPPPALLAFRIAALRHPFLSPYPPIATAGVFAALWLSQRSARRLGLSPAALWDAGVFALVATVVLSRLLGVALLVAIGHGHLTLSLWDALRLSSVSYLSLLLTGFAVLLWLRWRGVPILRSLDAWAAPAALLWAAIHLAEAASTPHPALPTSLPWGVRAAGLPGSLRVHPVGLYAAVIGFLLCLALLRLLRSPLPPGTLAALALLAGGLAVFFLDMLQLPDSSTGPLDTTQWIALAAILSAGCLLALTRPAAPRPPFPRPEPF
ncbi:MAG TPA: prolipoprotein diacylglyceryl transferase family protein [Acidobacteriaceae bacterium]|jgi:phosphatidylglycerol:prolipoprotein diacylglycerol transferase|nr:prolipoprotein diacylglyceryl transferase family protein [Acidobacteriaceae bacterium]